MKILFFDIETAPNKAYVWGLWHEVRSMDFVASNWYVLCWSAKWLGDKEVMSSGIYSKSENDKQIMKKLWKLLDEADIVVAHNAKKFDCRKVNTRFIAHGIKPPSPYRILDTLLEARRYFSFASNKLNDLGKFLDVGEKVKTGGFELWKGCMSGDKKSWKKMVEYCEKDVELLEKVYLRLRPYMATHPNLGVDDNRSVCPKCQSPKIQYRGFVYSNTQKYRKFTCKACGAWARERTSMSSTNLTNV